MNVFKIQLPPPVPIIHLKPWEVAKAAHPTNPKPTKAKSKRKKKK